MAKSDFDARAARLGHAADPLRAGEVVSADIDVGSVDDLRDLLRREAPREERVRLAAAAPGEDDTTPQAVLERVQAYVFGDRPLSEADREAIAGAFPLKVASESAQSLTIKGKLDLGTSAGIVIRNYGTVTMEDGAYVTIQNTALQWTMDTLVRNGAPPAGRGDFNVLGATGGGGGAGPTGGHGTAGTDGRKASCGGAGAKDGTTGDRGAVGGTGGAGRTGLPSLVADITVTTGITGASQLSVLTRSGTGGAGGRGGAGGSGGAGGKGGDGINCFLCTGIAPGNGGPGGAGGAGARGGEGGAGADAVGDVNVLVPAGWTSKVVKLAYPAPAGEGGPGGGGGKGGAGGGGGAESKQHDAGTKGKGGPAGGAGITGPAGAADGAPARIHVQAY